MIKQDDLALAVRNNPGFNQRRDVTSYVKVKEEYLVIRGMIMMLWLMPEYIDSFTQLRP